jgi:hypothetical protein
MRSMHDLERFLRRVAQGLEERVGASIGVWIRRGANKRLAPLRAASEAAISQSTFASVSGLIGLGSERNGSLAIGSTCCSEPGRPVSASSSMTVP